MNAEEIIAELKKLQPDQRVKLIREVLARIAEEDYKKRQTEYDLQEEQKRQLSRKHTNDSDDYGILDYTP